jgi:LDH2 family malate/lactate/ureidoglycolate dehydrogenase
MPSVRCETSKTDEVKVTEAALRRVVTEIFEKLGVSSEDAMEGADVLVMSDLRGVDSHGVSNMFRTYVKGYQEGRLNPAPGWKLLKETAATAVIDAERRLGVIIGPKAMRLAVKKAKAGGVGVVTVCNGGHFGAIGHHAMIAAEQDMVGLCLVGVGGFDLSVLPTFSAEPMFGTNPIAIAAPAEKEAPFLFDVATSVIAGNKIRSAIRTGEPLLPGWVADKQGHPLDEATHVQDRYQFYLLPLGGTRELGSHKGYGLSMTAEILSSLLSGGLPNMLDPNPSSKAHFAAYDISAFTDLEYFKSGMDRMLVKLRKAKPAEGQARVLYPGLIEAEELRGRRRKGISLHKEVIQWFDNITVELGIPSIESRL